MKRKVGFHPTFSRHGIAQASLALLIWLNEKVLLLSCIIFSQLAFAQSDPRIIILDEPGILQSLISSRGLEQEEWLKVIGELNGSDIKTLRHLLGGIYSDPTEQREGHLKRLDLH